MLESRPHSTLKSILLLDSTGSVIRTFVDYKTANHYRAMNNRYDWKIVQYTW